MGWLQAAGARLNASKGVPIKALSIICSFLKKHHNNVPNLFTSMESGVDYASSVDQEKFSALVEAMKSVGAGTTKANKSSREKTYACKVLLPEVLASQIGKDSFVVEGLSSELVGVVKKKTLAEIKAADSSFLFDPDNFHLNNFNGDPMNDEATLRDAKGKGRGQREFKLEVGPGKLQNSLQGCEPYLVAACLKFCLRIQNIPIVPFDKYNLFVESFKQTKSALDLGPALASLPQTNQNAFVDIVTFLAKLQTGEAPRTIASMFTPVLIRHKKTAASRFDLPALEIIEALLRAWGGLRDYEPVKAKPLCRMLEQGMECMLDDDEDHLRDWEHPPAGATSADSASVAAGEVKPAAALKPALATATNSAAPSFPCASCGNKLIAGTKFCEDCGTRVAAPKPTAAIIPSAGIACPECNHMYKVAPKFCTECGSSVSTGGGLAPSNTRLAVADEAKKVEKETQAKEQQAKEKEDKRKRMQEEREKEERRRRAQKAAREQATAERSAATAQERQKKAFAEAEKRAKRMQAIDDKERQEAELAKRNQTDNRAATANTGKKKGKLSALAGMWDAKQKKANSENTRNVFSKDYTGTTKLRVGDAGYGKAPEGSESAARAKRATEWVKTQIKQLVGVIKEIGQVGGTGLHETNFKDLFIRYETISDTVVGILQRAKKYGVVIFEGEMLFQGQSDAVVIGLTPHAEDFCHKN